MVAVSLRRWRCCSTSANLFIFRKEIDSKLASADSKWRYGPFFIPRLLLLDFVCGICATEPGIKGRGGVSLFLLAVRIRCGGLLFDASLCGRDCRSFRHQSVLLLIRFSFWLVLLRRQISTNEERSSWLARGTATH